jgi:hypothetical protein
MSDNHDADAERLELIESNHSLREQRPDCDLCFMVGKLREARAEIGRRNAWGRNGAASSASTVGRRPAPPPFAAPDERGRDG